MTQANLGRNERLRELVRRRGCDDLGRKEGEDDRRRKQREILKETCRKRQGECARVWVRARGTRRVKAVSASTIRRAPLLQKLCGWPSALLWFCTAGSNPRPFTALPFVPLLSLRYSLVRLHRRLIRVSCPYSFPVFLSYSSTHCALCLARLQDDVMHVTPLTLNGRSASNTSVTKMKKSIADNNGEGTAPHLHHPHHHHHDRPQILFSGEYRSRSSNNTTFNITSSLITASASSRQFNTSMRWSNQYAFFFHKLFTL